MPAADTVLLPLALGLTLLGIIGTGVAWRRGNKGRVLQGVALALAPVALYFSGLLRLLWDGVVAVASWAGRVILSPPVWFGLGLLGLCVVLWVVGALVARRSGGRKTRSKAVAAQPDRAGATRNAPAVPGRRPAQNPAAADKAPVDDDLAEIEALLKQRGIN